MGLGVECEEEEVGLALVGLFVGFFVWGWMDVCGYE